LIEQVKIAIKVFEYTHPDCIAIFTFDRSSAHEGFAKNALNINNMNINPGGKQRKIRDTVIPICNPDPSPDEEDTRSRVQRMTFPNDHPDPKLWGQAKGIRAVLQERKSVWDKLVLNCSTKPVRKCASCTKSQTCKDAERRVAFVEATGEGAASAEDIAVADTPSTPDNSYEWCCMHHVLALQEDFRSEKPLIQWLIEDAGHICLFLPQFHCELNPIEMLWGYGKFRAHISLSPT
jgi:hypothetical protein